MQDVWKWVGPSVSIGFCFVQFLFQKQFGVSSLSASNCVSGAPHRGRGATEWPARNRTRADLKGVSNPQARKREERSTEHWTRRTLKLVGASPWPTDGCSTQGTRQSQVRPHPWGSFGLARETRGMSAMTGRRARCVCVCVCASICFTLLRAASVYSEWFDDFGRRPFGLKISLSKCSGWGCSRCV